MTTTIAIPELLNSTQVAAKLGISTASIYKLATASKLPPPDDVHGTIKLWGSEKVEQIRQQIASKVDRRRVRSVS